MSLSPDADSGPRFATGVTLVSLARASAAVCGFGTSVVAARALGPAGTGRYAVLTTSLIILAVVAAMGLHAGFGWAVGGGRWTLPAALRGALLAAAGLGIAGALLGTLGYALLADSVYAGADIDDPILVLLGIPLLLGWGFMTHIAVARRRYRVAAMVTVTQPLATLAAMIVLAPRLGLDGAVLAMLIGQAVAIAVALAALRRCVASSLTTSYGTRGHLARALRFGRPVWAAGTLDILMRRADLPLVAALAGTRQAGYYAVAAGIAGSLEWLPGGLATALLPALASVGEHQSERRDALGHRGARHTVILGTAGALLVAAAIAPLLPILYGSRFRPAIGPLLILLPGVAALALAATLYAALAGRGRPGYMVRGSLISTPLSVALYLALIPALHASGAALASTLSYLASVLLAARYYSRETRASVRDFVVPRTADLRAYDSLFRSVVARRVHNGAR